MQSRKKKKTKERTLNSHQDDEEENPEILSKWRRKKTSHNPYCALTEPEKRDSK